MGNRRQNTFPELTFKTCLKIVLIIIFIGMIYNWFYYEISLQQVQGQIVALLSKYGGPLSSQGKKGSVENGNCGFDINFIEENLYSLDQKDKRLIEYTRIKYLTPPSKLPYKLNDSKAKKDKFNVWVYLFFKNRKNGIFIEAGANDGETASHTLYLEMELGWTGLLVECNPTLAPYLLSHHRKAWVATACLSPGDKPGKLNFSNPTNWTQSGTFRKPWRKDFNWEFFEVETIPLYSILKALEWKEIDFFSFDIEAGELAVLKAFPFDEIIFKVLFVEVYFYKAEEKQELDKLLKVNGYHFVKLVNWDHIYVHKSVKHLLDDCKECL